MHKRPRLQSWPVYVAAGSAVGGVTGGAVVDMMGDAGVGPIWLGGLTAACATLSGAIVYLYQYIQSQNNSLVTSVRKELGNTQATLQTTQTRLDDAQERLLDCERDRAHLSGRIASLETIVAHKWGDENPDHNERILQQQPSSKDKK